MVAVDEPGVGLVEHEQHRAVAGLVAAVGLDAVVQAQHRGRRAALQDAAARVEAVGERREPERRATVRRGDRMGAQPGAGDDAERAFRADEELREVGADRGAGAPPVWMRAAVGEHDVEPGDDVLDLAVAGRELAGAPAREPAADGRERDRLRPVPARDARARRAACLRRRRRRCRRARRRPSRCDRRRRCPRARRGRARRRRAPGCSRRRRRCAPPRPSPAPRLPRTRAAPRRPRRPCAGRTTTPASAGTCWPSAQCIASGHQSRLDSLSVAGVGADRRARRAAVRRAHPLLRRASPRVVRSPWPRRRARSEGWAHRARE